jgi:hypothetical protein
MTRLLITALILVGCATDATDTATQDIAPIAVPDDVCEALTGELAIEGDCYDGDSIIACAGNSDVGFCWGGGESGCWGPR